MHEEKPPAAGNKEAICKSESTGSKNKVVSSGDVGEDQPGWVRTDSCGLYGNGNSVGDPRQGKPGQGGAEVRSWRQPESQPLEKSRGEAGSSGVGAGRQVTEGLFCRW